MNLQEAIGLMIVGKKIKLPEWTGYWFIPENEKIDPSDAGKSVQVVTKDGNILNDPWFYKYEMRTDFEVTEGEMGFDFAILAMKNGKMVARKGWNGANMFGFMRPADSLPISFVRDGVKSLPQSVKDWYKRYANGDTHYASAGSPEIKIHFGSYLCLKTVNDSIANGWQPSQTDMLAEDWYLVD
jgi:hypothetical protein